MMALRVLLSLLLNLPLLSFAQGVSPVSPVSPTGTRLFPNAFASADNIAAQTATAMHGLVYIWDGSNWDRWTGAVTQSGTWTVTANAGTNLNTSALLTTTAHDAAFGTAGAADAQVRTVQGIASMTPLQVQSNGSNLATATLQDGIIRDGTGDTTQANVSSGRVHVDGSGVTQPVSGTVTANAGTGTFFDGILRDGTGDTTQANVISGNLQVTCTNCSGSGAAHVDNAAFTGGTDDVAPMGALYDTTPPTITDGSLGAPRMNVNRQLLVECAVGCAGGSTTPTDNFANPTTAGLSFNFNAWWDGATWDRAPGNATDGLLVNLGANNDVTVTGSVSLSAALPAGTNNIGDVDVLSLPSVTIGTFPDNEPFNISQMNGVAVTMGNGASGTGVQRVTIASDSTGTVAVTQATASNLNAQVVGAVAHDTADSGNPVKIGCHARTTNRTAVADADRADVVCDDNGQLIFTPMAPRDRVVRSGVITLTTTTETTLVAAGGAGVFRDLTYLKCTNSSASLTRVDLRDATAGTVIDSWQLAANGGGFNLAFSVPYNQATANNNWTIQLGTAVTDVRCSAQAVEKN